MKTVGGLVAGALVWGCTTSGQSGDTDFTWEDQGTTFEGPPCQHSSLVGEWAEVPEPEVTRVIFESSCAFTETTQTLCPGGAEYENVTATSGSVTIDVGGSVCATCTYTVTVSPESLELDCGVAGVPTSFVPTDYGR